MSNQEHDITNATWPIPENFNQEKFDTDRPTDEIAPKPRKRGRPKGSKNKSKIDRLMNEDIHSIGY